MTDSSRTNEPDSTTPAPAPQPPTPASSADAPEHREPQADPAMQPDEAPQTMSEHPDFAQLIQEGGGIERLNDVDLDVKIELGRTQLTVEHILKLGEGSVVELDKLAGDPVDVLVNEQLIARGEVLVVNDNFCVRINEILPGVSEAAKRL